MEEATGFEPVARCRAPVFETGAINHSATLPYSVLRCPLAARYRERDGRWPTAAGASPACALPRRRFHHALARTQRNMEEGEGVEPSRPLEPSLVFKTRALPLGQPSETLRGPEGAPTGGQLFPGRGHSAPRGNGSAKEAPGQMSAAYRGVADPRPSGSATFKTAGVLSRAM